MKNRIPICGAILLLTLVAAGYFKWSVNAVAGVVFIIAAGILCLIFRKIRIGWFELLLTVMFCMGAGFCLISIKQYRFERAFEAVNDDPVQIKGFVSDLPSYDGKYRYELSVDELNGNEIKPIKVELVSEGALFPELYDRVEGEVRLYPAERLSGAVAAYATRTKEGELKFTPSSKRDVNYYLCLARKKLIGRLDSMYTGDTLGFVKGVLLGDATGLSEQAQLKFSKCGLTHVIVVSGMHLTVLSGFILNALQLLSGRSRRRCALFAMLPIFAFVALIGFTPSVLRAGIAMLIHLTAIILREDIDCLTSLAWAVILLAVIDPTVVTSAGFLLSVFAVIGIEIVGQRIIKWARDGYWRRRKRKLPKLSDALVSAVATTFGATVMTLPLSMIYFPRVSTVALPANLIIFFAADLMLMLGLPMLVALLIGADKLAVVIGLPVGLCGKYCVEAVNWLSRLFKTSLPTYGSICAALGGLLIVIAVLSLVLNKMRVGAVVCAVAVAVTFVAQAAVSGTSVRLTVTESGCFIRDKQGEVSVIGFDEIYSADYDLSRVVYTYDVERFGLVVWNDFDDLLRLLKIAEVDWVVSNKEALASADIPERHLVISNRAEIAVNSVVYSCEKDRVLLRVGETEIEVWLALSQAEPSVSAAPLVIRQVTDAEGQPFAQIAVRDKTLASGRNRVYNSGSQWYSIVIFDSGYYWIEKG